MGPLHATHPLPAPRHARRAWRTLPSISSTGGAAREVAHGLGEALEHRAVGVRMAEDLHELDADVAGMEVGEDEDVRPSGDLARALHLVLRHRGHDGGIELELAIAHEVRGGAHARARPPRAPSRATRAARCPSWRTRGGATRGSQPRRVAAVSAEAIAMPASSSTPGCTVMAQSARPRNSPCGPSNPGISAMPKLEGEATPSARPTMPMAAATTSPVGHSLPDATPSTSPSFEQEHGAEQVVLRPARARLLGEIVVRRRVALDDGAHDRLVGIIDVLRSPPWRRPPPRRLRATRSASPTSTGTPISVSTMRCARRSTFGLSTSESPMRRGVSAARAIMSDMKSATAVLPLGHVPNTAFERDSKVFPGGWQIQSSPRRCVARAATLRRGLCHRRAGRPALATVTRRGRRTQESILRMFA